MAEGRSWGLAGAAGLAEETLALARQLAGSETPHPRATAGLGQDIAGFAGNLLAGRPAGASRRRR